MLRTHMSRSRLTRRDAAVEHEPPPSSPAAKKKLAGRSLTLNADNLEQLGARRLAELLMTHVGADTVLARTLRLALAETEGSGRLAAEIEKRLRTIRRSSSFVDWDKVTPLARELEGLRDTIAGPLAEVDPRAAVTQMRLFLDLAKSVFERSDDGSGLLGDVFRQAGGELGRLWAMLPSRDPVALARDLLAMLDSDDYGATDLMLEAASPALGTEGRAELRRILLERLAALPPADLRQRFPAWRGRGELAWRLGQIADLEDDVDAFIAAMETDGYLENRASDIAERLNAKERAEEALAWLDRAPPGCASDDRRQIDLRIAALDIIGRGDEAQSLRWKAFERWLSTDHLRAYLRKLPDFEDVEAEDKAIAYALEHTDRHLGLAFLIEWRNLEAANKLVRAQPDAFDGRDYGRLRPAAEALAEKYPAAATLLHRALAEDVLKRASSRQYQYAARDVRSCADLAPFLPEGELSEDHEAFTARLKREHGRKTGFWTILGET